MLDLPLSRILTAGLTLALPLFGALARAGALVPQAIPLGHQTFQAQVAPGFRLEWLNGELDGPRMPTFDADGTLFIGSRSGHVYRLPPPYHRAEIFAELSGYPHSVAFRPGEIWIARSAGLYRAPYRPGQRHMEEDRLTLMAPLPVGGHSSRTVRSGPDGRIYLSLGIAGNCSDQYLGPSYAFSQRRGGVMVWDEQADPPRLRAYASGLRNPVGFDWNPADGHAYASNNGPDHLGYEQPPEQFTRLEEGSFHGMPWFQFDGQRVFRDRCISTPAPRRRQAVTRPVATFPARNAPMGVAFFHRGPLAGDAVVALHGSWGTRPRGGFRGDPASRRPPKLVRVRFDGARVIGVEDLVSGFQDPEDGHRWARPVGVAEGPDGVLYFTSDSGLNGLFRLVPVAH